MKHIAYWWVFFWAQTIGLAVAYYYGFITTMWENDVSYISAAIAGILILGTLDVGRHIHMAAKGNFTEPRFAWFLADAATAFGLIGTVVGFIVMMNSAMTDMDGVVTTANLKIMIASLNVGIGTAVWTTLAGLITSVSIKYQLNNYDIMVSRLKQTSAEIVPDQIPTVAVDYPKQA